MLFDEERCGVCTNVIEIGIYRFIPLWNFVPVWSMVTACLQVVSFEKSRFLQNISFSMLYSLLRSNRRAHFAELIE
jgi:hypothetical protein